MCILLSNFAIYILFVVRGIRSAQSIADVVAPWIYTRAWCSMLLLPNNFVCRLSIGSRVQWIWADSHETLLGNVFSGWVLPISFALVFRLSLSIYVGTFLLCSGSFLSLEVFCGGHWNMLILLILPDGISALLFLHAEPSFKVCQSWHHFTNTFTICSVCLCSH